MNFFLKHALRLASGIKNHLHATVAAILVLCTLEGGNIKIQSACMYLSGLARNFCSASQDQPIVTSVRTSTTQCRLFIGWAMEGPF